jgi:proteasome assembly chaperone (PAC2) family protein
MWKRNDGPNEEPESNDDTLIEWISDATEAESRILIHGISGFLDAGNAVRIAVEHILASTEHRLLASFDIDLLFDYRGRRPRMSYLTDHFDDIELPYLNLVECVDENGNTFLLLHGSEPDLGWMTVVDEITSMVEDLNVELTVGIQAVPFPSPHTRPVPVTAHATDLELIAGRQPWVGDMEIPASFSGFLELQLGREGNRAVGYAAHVPHYLANIDYPRAALSLIVEMMAISGIEISQDDLRELADTSDQELNEQIAESPENQAVVSALEESFDALVAERGGITQADMVSGDVIAAQVEQFLADMDARGRESE